MNTPFWWPALISFGPLFLLMFILSLTGWQRRKEVPRYQIVAAYVLCVSVGIAGAAASFWLFAQQT